MTEAEFEAQINRLMRVYGDRIFSPDRIQVYLASFRHMSAAAFQEGVSLAIAEFNTAPSISKLKECVESARKKLQIEDPHDETRRELTRATHNQSACSRCLNSGTLVGVDRLTRCEYVFLCTCRYGTLAASLPENQNKIRAWSLAVERDFYRKHERPGRDGGPPDEDPPRIPEAQKQERLQNILSNTLKVLK